MKTAKLFLVLLLVFSILISPALSYVSFAKNPETGEESTIVNAFKENSTSVVTISRKPVKESSVPTVFNLFDLLTLFTKSYTSTNTEPSNIGSGFIVSPDGFVVTNKHVVSDTKTEYFIKTSTNQTFPVIKIYTAHSSEIALLKVSAGNLKPVSLGDSDQVEIGQTAIAIGTALGELQNTLTVGIISGRGRKIVAVGPGGETDRLTDLIQTDAAINPGNSGGPLFNSSGQVIGVNTAISPYGENIGFAVPINEVKNLVTKLKLTL